MNRIAAVVCLWASVPGAILSGPGSLLVGEAIAQTGMRFGDAEELCGPSDLFSQTRFFDRPRSMPLRRTPVELATASLLSTNSFPDGDGPAGVTLTPDGRLALIPEQESGTLSVIDTWTAISLAEIAVGEYPQSVAVTPDGRYALTADAYNSTVSVVDLESLTRVKSILVPGVNPYRVVISRDGSRAVVGMINDAQNSGFAVIDLTTLELATAFSSAPQGQIGSFYTPETGAEGFFYSEFTLTPDGSTILLLDRLNSALARYDVATGASLGSVLLPLWPTAIDVSSDGTFAVISHETGQRRISRVNLLTGVATNYSTPGDISGQVIRLTPDASSAMVISGSNLIFVDLASGLVTDSIPLVQPQSFALIGDGSRALVVGGQAAVIDVNQRAIEATLAGGFAFVAAASHSVENPVAVGLNNRLRESLLVYRVNPLDAFFDLEVQTGPAPESDRPRVLVVSPDGRTAAAVNDVSGNVCIWDLAGVDPARYVDVGNRPLNAAFSPDGAWLVVPSADDFTVSIIDMSPGPLYRTVVATVPVAARPARVVVANDSSKAFVVCVDADVVQVVSLEGSNSAVIGSFAAGQVGQSTFFSYLEFAGMALSPDGSILAVCDNGGKLLRLFNSTTYQPVASITVGSSPFRVIFNAAGTRAYVANAGTDNVSVVSVNGASSTRLANVPAGDGPLSMALDVSERYLYVGAFGTVQPGVAIIDTQTNTQVAFADLGGYRVRDMEYVASCGQLLVASTGEIDDRFFRLRAAGVDTSLIEVLPLSWSPADLVVSSSLNLALMAQPVFDGVDVVQLPLNADLNRDGEIDFQDFLEFFGGFDTGSPVADLDGSGEVDFSDFLVFFGSFDVGCL
jgi:YVTN family beta-propeller protein